MKPLHWKVAPNNVLRLIPSDEGTMHAAGLTAKAVPMDKVQDYLQRHFRDAFRERQEMLIQRAAFQERQGPVVAVNGAVTDVGSRFRLTGLDCPTRQLQAFLMEMEANAAYSQAHENDETGLHLLRIVATPGLGKVELALHTEGSTKEARSPKSLCKRAIQRSEIGTGMFFRVGWCLGICTACTVARSVWSGRLAEYSPCY